MQIRPVLIVVAAVVAVFGLIASGSSGDSSSSRGSGVPQGSAGAGKTAAPGGGSASAAPTGAAADIEIVGCETDPTLNSPVAHLKITNHSSKSSNYLVTIAFDSADGKTQVDTGLASVDNLLPGQASNVDASSLKSDVPAGFVCKIADVTRYAA